MYSIPKTKRQRAIARRRARLRTRALIDRGDYHLRTWLYVFALAFAIFWEAVFRARAYTNDLWPIDDSGWVFHETFWIIPVAIATFNYFYKPKLPDFPKRYVMGEIVSLFPIYFVYMVYDTAQSRAAIANGSAYYATVNMETDCGSRKMGGHSLINDCSNFHQQVVLTDIIGRTVKAYRYYGIGGINCVLVQPIKSSNGSQWLRVLELDPLTREYDDWGNLSEAWQNSLKNCTKRPVLAKA
jgi:hypothetical protein